MNFTAMAPIFSGVFLAELGDKTQIATVCFMARGGLNRLEVFLAAGTALVLSTFLGVVFGQAVGHLLPAWLLKSGAGLIFIVLGLLFLREGVTLRRRGAGGEPPCA